LPNNLICTTTKTLFDRMYYFRNYTGNFNL